MNAVNQFVDQFRQVWAGTNTAQRALLVVAVAAVLLGLGAVIFFTGAGDRVVLYAGLSEQDAAAVVAELRDRGIPYSLNETGNTIRVPRSEVAETRLLLAGAGLPHGGGPGFELFDRTEFGVTDFAQKVNFKRATEGELERTINRMQEVAYARVQLVMPEERVFGRDQSEPKASVFLALEPGRTLNRNQVRAVQHLVASAVERLSADNVTITDQHAQMLAAPTDSTSTAALSATQLEVQRAVERSMQAKVQHILDRVVGPGRSAVAVTLALDFDRVERTEESYDPKSQVVRSEQVESEKSSETQPSTQGGVGVTANLPTASAVTATGSSGSNSKSERIITNYEINKTVEHIVQSPGTIRSVSVSAVVDGTYTEPAGGGEKQYQPRSDEEMERLRKLVAAAVGTSVPATVEVLNVPLDTTVQEAETLAADEARRMRTRELIVTVARYVIIAVVALIAFAVLRSILTRMTPARPALRPGMTAEELQAAMAGRPGARFEAEVGEETDAERVAHRLQDLSREHPEEMAALVKSWMVER